ncbi:MAG: hypothetical protein HY053_05640 [Proteobacteria bacterium]|nr:hypothetical protein [Pseudomonadota bacterium]
MTPSIDPRYLEAARIIFQAREEVLAKIDAGLAPLAGNYILPAFHKGLSEWDLTAFPRNVVNCVHQRCEQLYQSSLYSNTFKGHYSGLVFLDTSALKSPEELALRLAHVDSQAEAFDSGRFWAAPERLSAFDLFATFLHPKDRARFVPLRRHMADRIDRALKEEFNGPYTAAQIKEAVKTCTGVKNPAALAAAIKQFSLYQRYGIFKDPRDARLVELFIDRLKKEKFEFSTFFQKLALDLPANDHRFIPEKDSASDKPALIHRHLRRLLGDYYDDLVETQGSPLADPEIIDPAERLAEDVGEIFDEAQRMPLGGRVRNTRQRARELARAGLE